MKNEILVSISCIAYNHEPYIADAIDSFLMQKTNFKFEILIHDDASTDKTAEIIKKYENKYPGIINTIFQNENQYSKGVKVGTINNSRANGKYMAICEGDDYWTDPYKLQKQVDFLEENPEYSLCVHAAKRVDAKTKKEFSEIRPVIRNKEFSTEEVISRGGGLFPTNSMVYRRKESLVTPDFYNNAPVGDYPLTIFLSLIGKVHYMDEFMSAYRTNVEGSWTNRTLSDINKTISYIYKRIGMLDEINIYTEGEYLAVIENTKLYNRYLILQLKGNYREIKEGECSIIYNSLNFKGKAKIFIKQYLPSANNFLKSIRGKYKSWALK
ncbi:putative glycosyltransferase - possibly involved in cell wall localization and side chain formation of rhamnose-glucose polysaccharide [Alkalibacterium sp. AK22]|uniref:glycosyltransferase family 2 protein n=1 Tax=Alkalibacterium sp. AK22 TaxID=1229520 RepID=UPI000447B8D2|nr:glycosyltransferase [Alkalibacterium sp. AK22]EXJ23323.1 putative glycosyltransferase - possibly involved in cell wall localization and side chain formation of rhamnose-glucose polysaccharide [Alkalibacterium sp. AK22]